MKGQVVLVLILMFMKSQVVLVLILMGNGNNVVICCELRVYLLCVHPIYSVPISAPMMMKE